MPLLARGRYSVCLAETREDAISAQRLRYETFIEGRDTAPSGERAAGLDADAFDNECDHVLISDIRTGDLVCCFRLMPLESGAYIERSYSAQYYELSALHDFFGPVVEMGRFCIHPDHRNPDVLRVAWAAMTQYVEERGVELLFGCSSFTGVDAQAYTDAFALLKEKHLAPKRWLPRIKAPKVFPFAKRLRLKRPDPKIALKTMPPLLRGYLSLGGWVSDHAVIDHDLNTLHVFTGLEIKRVPPRMVHMLRRV